jgi:hypothetical protein
LSGNALALNDTFTQDDINTSKVTYTQDGTDNNDSFSFSVAASPGAAATGTFTITFTEAATTITANTGLYKGTILDPDGNTIVFRGAVLEKTGTGEGFFLGVDQSGQALLGPVVP